MFSSEELRARQSLPLGVKEALSAERIAEWYDYYSGNVCVSFSGGLDSTVLLHLVRRLYPQVPAVFVDTGLEYPEVRRFAVSVPNVHIIRPAMRFHEVIEKYGYPVVSKIVSQGIHEVRAARTETATAKTWLTGIKADGSRGRYRIPNKWQYLLEAPFKISHRCCAVLKKAPQISAQRRLGGAYPYIGMRAADGRQREFSYLLRGCNAFDLRHPRSMPLAVWTDLDVRAYIRTNRLSYSEIYDAGWDHTGCMFCMFGVHLEDEPNRFQRMKLSHPRLWDYCIDKLGCGAVLEYMGIPYEPQKRRRPR